MGRTNKFLLNSNLEEWLTTFLRVLEAEIEFRSRPQSLNKGTNKVREMRNDGVQALQPDS